MASLSLRNFDTRDFCLTLPDFLTSATDQAKVLQSFEALKRNENGWKMCLQFLLTEENIEDQQRFFCYQVIEDYLAKRRPETESINDHNTVRSLVSQLLQKHASSIKTEPTFLRNKLAQLLALVFIADFPTRWPTFINDALISKFAEAGGTKLVDLFLRLLMAVDGYVVDVEISHTAQELERNSLIKDSMRELCINDVIAVIYQILVQAVETDHKIAGLCLNVIGAYVSWVDINLVANDKVIPLIVQCMKRSSKTGGLNSVSTSSNSAAGIYDSELYECAVNCLCGLVSKKIENVTMKLRLLDAVDKFLEQSAIYTEIFEEEDPDTDCLTYLADLVNSLGLELIECWVRASKTAPLGAEANEALALIKAKVPILLKLFGHEELAVSSETVEFAHQLLIVIKQLLPPNHEQFHPYVKEMLIAVIRKYRVPEDYDHEHEGETEALFQEYRKDIKIIFTNIGSMDPMSAVAAVDQLAQTAFGKWQQCSYADVELAMALIYLFGESFTVTQPNFISLLPQTTEPSHVAVRNMLDLMVTSGVSGCKHKVVNITFFELISRYEKYMCGKLELIPLILVTFLDDRGLRHASATVRCRSAYFFAKFIKAARLGLQAYVDQILAQVEPLLGGEFGRPELLGPDDQIFLYEAVGQLIVAGNYTPEQKRTYIVQLLGSLWQKFTDALKRLDGLPAAGQNGGQGSAAAANDPEATKLLKQQRKALIDYLNSVMNYASRTSKAFTAQVTMDSCQCSDVFLRLMVAFLSSLERHRPGQLVSGVRQYLHRMVACLNAPELLPYLPELVSRFLVKLTPDTRTMIEFLVLLQQIVAKYKRDCLPFFQDQILIINRGLWAFMALPFDASDEVLARDMQTLRRAYFQFVTNIAQNIPELIAVGSTEEQQKCLLAVVQGASDSADPLVQKNCFTIFCKLIDHCKGSTKGAKASAATTVPDWLNNFILQQIIPACFIAPTKPGFDLADAQCNQVLLEIATCLKRAFHYKGQSFVDFLTNEFFPASNIPSLVAQQFCAALRSMEAKQLHKYLKEFFAKLLASAQPQPATASVASTSTNGGVQSAASN